jgi:sugar lactone lactonase YvrE
MVSRISRVGGLAALAVALGCGGGAEPVLSCDPVGAARPLCGFHNPEDLALLPDGRSLLVSEFGSLEGAGGGALARLDIDTDRRTLLFRGGDAAAGAPTWGDADCPGPPSAAFSPHGIDLARRADGALALYVVNHGGRESVELFEVLEDRSGARVAWRGCAPAPPGSWLNDVAATPEDGFLATHMMPRRAPALQMLEYLRAGVLGARTGHVLEWRPGRGFEQVPGTEVAFANGIELSPDGRTIFLNSSAGGAVLKIDRASGTLEGRAEVPGPDNSTWAADGTLRVASFPGSLREVIACGDLQAGACAAEFQIVALDPETLASEVLYRNAGPPMGAGTVGLEVGDELFIGSFAGDRILRVALRR